MARGNPQRELLALAASQHGYVRPEDALAAGVDPVRLRQMARRGTFERVDRGIYRARDIPVGRHDDLMRAVLWPQGVRGVISHESALDFHGLCDVNPADYDITVPAAYRVRRRTPPSNYRLHHRDLAASDVTYLDDVPVVVPMRAVLDGIEAGVRDSMIHQAIDTLRRRRELRPDEEAAAFAALEQRRRG